MKNSIFIAVYFFISLNLNGCKEDHDSMNRELGKYFQKNEVEELQKVNYPGKIAILSYGTKDSKESSIENDWITNLLNKAYQENYFVGTILENDRAKANGTLQELLIDRNCSANPLDEEAKKRLLEAAFKNGLGVKPEEAQDAIRLIKTGEFYRDISTSVVAVTKLSPDITYKIIENPSEAKSKFFNSFNIIKMDIKDNRSVVKCLKNLNKEPICESPKVLQHSLKLLYENPTVSEIIVTTNRLLDKESVQLAIILYARANGIDIEKEDIEAAQQILSTEDPELISFFRTGYDRLIEKYDINEVKRKIEAMGKNNNCKIS